MPFQIAAEVAAQQARPCPVCLSSTAQALHHNHLEPIAGFDLSYRVARCTQCGFHFADRLPQASVYRAYYDGLSKYDLLQPASALEQQRAAAALRICQRRALNPQARIVDLGCGSGGFLATLRQAGWTQLTGLDPAPNSPAAAQALYGLDCVRVGTLQAAPHLIDLQQADLLCLLAVLEHLPDLALDLPRLFGNLKPGCHVLIEVPALELFSAERGEPYGELSLEHIQFFSAISLSNLLGRLGLRVLEIEHLALPQIDSGSLFVWAQVPPTPIGAAHQLPEREPSAVFDAYLQGSAARMQLALSKVPQQPFVLYGAGSHSARLVAHMSPAQQNRLLAVFDANPNLAGKQWGRWQVQAPAALSEHLGVPILLSSYQSERAMASALAKAFSNPLVPLYTPADELI